MNIFLISKAYFTSKVYLENSMENEVKSPNDELQELMNEINSLTSTEIKNDQNTTKFNELLNELSNTINTNLASISQFTQEYKQRLIPCVKAFEELPVNPFEKAVQSSIDSLKVFLMSNDPSNYFIPQMQQKSTVILKFLSKISEIIQENQIYMKWAERALLDFDTQDWHIKTTAPDILKQFQNSISAINTTDSRMVLHIVRSLLLDFKA